MNLEELLETAKKKYSSDTFAQIDETLSCVSKYIQRFEIWLEDMDDGMYLALGLLESILKYEDIDARYVAKVLGHVAEELDPVTEDHQIAVHVFDERLNYFREVNKIFSSEQISGLAQKYSPEITSVLLSWLGNCALERGSWHSIDAVAKFIGDEQITRKIFETHGAKTANDLFNSLFKYFMQDDWRCSATAKKEEYALFINSELSQLKKAISNFFTNSVVATLNRFENQGINPALISAYAYVAYKSEDKKLMDGISEVFSKYGEKINLIYEENTLPLALNEVFSKEVLSSEIENGIDSATTLGKLFHPGRYRNLEQITDLIKPIFHSTNGIRKILNLNCLFGFLDDEYIADDGSNYFDCADVKEILESSPPFLSEEQISFLDLSLHQNFEKQAEQFKTGEPGENITLLEVKAKKQYIKNFLSVLKFNKCSSLEEVTDCSNVNIEGYKIIRRLGEGGDGVVYHTVHDTLGEVKVKIFKIPEGKIKEAQEKEGVSLEERVRRRLQKVEKKLRIFTNITRAYEVGSCLTFDGKDTFYITMDYVDGGAAEYRTKEGEYKIREDITEEEIFDIFDKILSGLDVIHNKGLVLRDLKLKNIMVSKDHEIVLIDDLETIAGIDEVKAGTRFTESPERYFAPEVFNNPAAYTVQSDLYSAGVCLLYMLSRKTNLIPQVNTIQDEDLYYEKLEGILEQFDFGESEDREAHLNQDFSTKKLLLGMLAYRQESRYKNAEEIKRRVIQRILVPYRFLPDGSAMLLVTNEDEKHKKAIESLLFNNLVKKGQSKDSIKIKLVQYEGEYGEY